MGRSYITLTLTVIVAVGFVKISVQKRLIYPKRSRATRRNEKIKTHCGEFGHLHYSEIK